MTSERTAVEARLHDKHDYTTAELNETQQAVSQARRIVRDIHSCVLNLQILLTEARGVLGMLEPRGAPSNQSPESIEKGRIG